MSTRLANLMSSGNLTTRRHVDCNTIDSLHRRRACFEQHPEQHALPNAAAPKLTHREWLAKVRAPQRQKDLIKAHRSALEHKNRQQAHTLRHRSDPLGDRVGDDLAFVTPRAPTASTSSRTTAAAAPKLPAALVQSLAPADTLCAAHFASSLPPHTASQWNSTLQLPVFCTAQQLTASPEWHAYLSWVYGADTLTSFPLDTRGFAIFYVGAPLPKPLAAAAAPLPLTATSAADFQLPFGTLYTTPHLRAVAHYAYVDYVHVHAFGASPYGLSPYARQRPSGLPNDALVEVRHSCCGMCDICMHASRARACYHLSHARLSRSHARSALELGSMMH